MITYPPAKINVGLNVIAKREDGFHDIESIFYAIPLVDILEINKSDNFSFTMSGLGIAGSIADNLVVRAYQMLKNEYPLSNVSIHLHKQIPMGAGLGGGSADASYTLTMLNSIFDLNLSVEQLQGYAAGLGSDCPFFIEATPKYITGTGHEMTPAIIDLAGLYLWLINPSIHVSTAEAYGGITPALSDQNLVSEILKPINAWKNTIKNDFEKSVFKNHPKLEEIKRKMYANGALYTSMSGSGSTMYAICDQKPTLLNGFDFEKIIQL